MRRGFLVVFPAEDDLEAMRDGPPVPVERLVVQVLLDVAADRLGQPPALDLAQARVHPLGPGRLVLDHAPDEDLGQVEPALLGLDLELFEHLQDVVHPRAVAAVVLVQLVALVDRLELERVAEEELEGAEQVGLELARTVGAVGPELLVNRADRLGVAEPSLEDAKARAPRPRVSDPERGGRALEHRAMGGQPGERDQLVASAPAHARATARTRASAGAPASSGRFEQRGVEAAMFLVDRPGHSRFEQPEHVVEESRLEAFLALASLVG